MNIFGIWPFTVSAENLTLQLLTAYTLTVFSVFSCARTPHLPTAYWHCAVYRNVCDSHKGVTWSLAMVLCVKARAC